MAHIQHGILPWKDQNKIVGIVRDTRILRFTEIGQASRTIEELFVQEIRLMISALVLDSDLIDNQDKDSVTDDLM